MATVPDPDGALAHLARAVLPVTDSASMDLDVYCLRRGGGAEQLALVLSAGAAPVPLVRIHSACLTGEALGSLRCDCGPQLRSTLDLLVRTPGGMLIYLPDDEGRGIGLVDKIRAYALQDAGMDTVEANRALGFPPDLRDYAAAVAVLRARGIRRVRLLTNNPDKIRALEDAGIRVDERVPHEPAASSASRSYLLTKKHLLGHLLS